MASMLGFLPNYSLYSRTLWAPSVSINHFVASRSHTSTVSYLSSNNTLQPKLKHLPQPQASSSEGIPGELIEDSKFVPLNAEDPRYGPPALLLLGFEVEEAMKIQQLLKELDGEFLEVFSCTISLCSLYMSLMENFFQTGIIFCTEDMITRPLWEAMNTRQPHLEAVKVAKSLPRICFLSGLSGEEMMVLIDAFPETGLEPAVFAALVPNSADKPLQELIEEIMGDHEMLTAKQPSST